MPELSERFFSRRRAVRFSRTATMLSLLAVIGTFVAESPFLWKLGASFAFFLFLFHWFFGAAKWLTVTHARLIDYVYLTIAATGVFILALYYEDKREEYVGADRAAAAYVDRRAQHGHFVESVAELERVSCDPSVVALMTSYCEQAKELRSVAVQESDLKPLEEAVQKYLDAAPPPNVVDAERSLAYQPIVRRIQQVQLEILGLKTDDLLTEFNKPLPPHEVGEYASDFYILFTWPFILAFAFALRITKTTIEVLDWTSPAPVLPTIKPVEEPLPEIGPFPPAWVRRDTGTSGELTLNVR